MQNQDIERKHSLATDRFLRYHGTSLEKIRAYVSTRERCVEMTRTPHLHLAEKIVIGRSKQQERKDANIDEKIGTTKRPF